MQTETGPIADLFIIGGGINGCGIARDAAGRGLSVTLAEQADLAQATSSASTKLFHGGLRYLEFFDFHLVREALRERETLLVAMPHISRPMRFVLPLYRDMRFEGDTPAGRLLSRMLPWMKGRRPDWMIRLGLFLYDHMGGRKILPATRSLDLRTDPAGRALDPKFRRAFEYSDCVVEDSRLVILNARDAALRGAKILTRTRVTAARRVGDLWRIETESGGATQIHHARALVNAAGPWVMEVLHDVTHIKTAERIRLVRGSHIVTHRLFDHDRSYFLQGEDGRIIFAIPYEQDFTLIGTTDQDHHDTPQDPQCSDSERDYLLAFASRYFAKPVTQADVVWSFAGVRPLYDDGADSATAATREYVLRVDDNGAPLLNVFGGKITTYRRLAEHALEKLAPYFDDLPADWTARVALPGGDFPHDGEAALSASLQAAKPWLPAHLCARLVRTYGTEAFALLQNVDSLDAMGQDFGAGLHSVELQWLMAEEWAVTAEDVVWRRTRLGLRLTPEQIMQIDRWMAGQRPATET